jgi:signal transduction histidine kinase
MTLQTKVTLGSVLLATIIVTVVSGVDVGSFIELELQATLERAAVIKDVAKGAVIDTLNRRREVGLRQALQDPDLKGKLLDLLGSLNGVLSIDIVSAENKEVLASTLENRVGSKPNEPEFRTLVNQSGWFEKLNVLLTNDRRYYMLQDPVGSSGSDTPLIYVRVVIYPTLIRPSLKDTLYKKAEVAVVSITGAVLLTLLFSMAVLRALGNIGHMLDRAASGEFEPEILPSENVAKDELSIMASKVNLLGQRLRGAQYEVSDLRGNIDHLLQDLEDAVFIFNRESRLVFASGAVEKFLGHDRSDLTGHVLSDLFPPSTMLGLLVAQASQTGRAIRNRRVPLGAPGEARTGPGIVLLTLDILESLPGGPTAPSGILVRLRDPEAQRKINRELQTADRLSAISRISSGVAHEVKNPLNAILLHVEVARSKISRGDTDVVEQMEIISREILRLDRVVRTFLDFTRPVELQLDNVPVQQLVHEIVDLAGPQTKAANIQMTVHDEVDGVEVRVDRDLLKQAMLNVVVNAIQAMPEGGELRFDASANEETAELRISDSGEGIPDELREKIFRLYFTTKRQGSGIGLAMTFRIVQLHDGTIDFTSEPGKGTTFLIRLPIAV